MTPKQKILYDCRKATFLLEKKAEIRLSKIETEELTLHLEACSVCRLYQTQSTWMNTVLAQFLRQTEISPLDKKFKTVLQNNVNERRQQIKEKKEEI